MAASVPNLNIAIRYCSNYGRTKAIAEEMAEEMGVKAASVADEPELTERVDVLFLGGAPYWSVMDPALEAYAKGLDPAMVGRVVLFTTSNWSRRTVLGLRDLLEERGFHVEPGHFYAHMTQIDQRKPAAREFARKTVQAIEVRTVKPARTGLAAELRIEAITVGAMAVGVALVVLTAAHLAKRRCRRKSHVGLARHARC